MVGKVCLRQLSFQVVCLENTERVWFESERRCDCCSRCFEIDTVTLSKYISVSVKSRGGEGEGRGGGGGVSCILQLWCCLVLASLHLHNGRSRS